MTTADLELLGTATTNLGLLRTRRLVTIQTIDIGRLTPQVLPLSETGGLVLVSGRGPVDSNESGKTTAQAAVDLLCMSHAWSPRSGRTGEWAAGLVFAPPSSRHRRARAEVGWIIGGFRDPEGRSTPPLTVIARIARTGDPKLRFRVLDGLHNVDAGSPQEYIDGAAQLWESAAANRTYSAQRYFEVVLGGQPRSAGYVNQRGNRESPAVTMFTADLRKVDPGRIADDLLELTGLDTMVANERKQRAQIAAKRTQIKSKREGAEVLRAETEAQLEVFDRRRDALQMVDAAAAARDAWVAAHAAEAARRVADLATQRRERLDSDDAEQLRGRVHDAQQEVQRLADPAALQQAVTDAHARVDDLRPGWEAAEKAVSEAQTARDRIDGRCRDEDLVAAADQASGRAAALIATDLEHATAALEQARTRRVRAGLARDEARRHLDAVTGAGSDAAAELAEARVGADVLADVVEVHDDHRALWDPLLAPWVDTLVVDPADVPAALDALAGRPGQTIASGPAEQVPEGIRSAPDAATGLLAALADGAAVHGTHVTAAALGVHVVGGYDTPQVGRQAHIDAAERAFADAKGGLETAEQLVEEAVEAVEELQAEHTAAVAAAKRTRLAAELAEAEEALDGRQRDREQLHPAWEAAGRRLDRAQRELDDHEAELEQAEQHLQDAEELLAAKVTTPADRLADQIRRWNLAKHVESLAGLVDDPTLGDGLDAADPHPDHVQRIERAADQVVAQIPTDDGAAPTEAGLQRRSTRLLSRALDRVGVVETANGSAEADPLVPAGVLAAHRHWLTQRDARPQTADTPEDETSPSSQAYRRLVEEARAWLEPRVGTDDVERDRLLARMQQTEDELDSAERGFAAEMAAAESYRASVQDLVEQQLEAIGDAFAQRVAASGGRGELKVHTKVSDDGAAGGRLDWEVVPCWSMHPEDDPVPYRQAKANTAQEKVRAIQLILAAFSTNGAPGRVLLLDELASGLGETNFSDQVAALARAAQREGLTILATVQDTHLSDAVDHAKQLLWFRYRSHEEMLNDPTVVLLEGPDVTVGMRYEQLVAGEDDWLELAAVEADRPVWDGVSPLTPDDPSALFDDQGGQ